MLDFSCVQSPASSPAERLRTALEMCDAGVEMMRLNLRRRFPEEGNEQIAARLSAWLRERPGAEHGDAPGRAVPWPPPPRP